MTRSYWAPFVLSMAVLAGCGGEEAPPDAKAWLTEADAAFARGDALVGPGRAAEGHVSFDDRADAVVAWAEAGRAYRNAFRLVDPEPAVAGQRGMLAFRAARALAKAARHGTEANRADILADRALTWFDQAARLVPDLRQVHYERARLFDSTIGAVADHVRAHGAYTHYLALAGTAGEISPGEQARVTHARERAKALAPPSGTVPRGPPKDGG